MRYLTHFVVAIVVLSGCRDNSPVQQNQPTLNALLIDGAHDGNKDFFFLPPLVANPVGTPNYDAGNFNTHLSPFVEVCELSANPILVPTTDCKSGPLVFGPARMSLGSEQYQLNWDTKASSLDALSFYRITVRGSARGAALGFVDIDPVLGGIKNVKTGDTFVFQDGRTLPIKVRIEQGAFGSGNTADRVEQVVPNVLPASGLDVTTNTGFAGAHFSNGWLPTVDGTPLDQVVVIIERIPVTNGAPQTSCLNTSLEQLEGCYRFRTDPDLHTLVPGTDLHFSVPVIAGICFQYPGDISTDNGRPFDLYRSEETAEGLSPAAPLLDEVQAPFLRCDGFGPTPPSIGAALRSGRLGDVAKAGLFTVTHAIGRVLQPKALHAVDLGAGGSTNDFSHFGWARRAMVSVTAGDGATAPAGSTIHASVSVQSIHHALTPPVAGQAVTFTVTGGGGSVVESQPVATDAQGIATVSWRLGLGINTLQVTTNYVSNSPALITAIGTPATGVIDFETYPDGSPTCASCGLTNEFTSRGVVFSFSGTVCPTLTNAQVLLSSSAYDPVGGPANHSVTAAGAPTGGFCSGTTTMSFAAVPDTVRFQLRGNNDIAEFPVAAFDGSGAPILAAEVARSDVSTYTSVSGFVFRQETVTIIHAGGIGRIDLAMNGFVALIDNLLILP